MSDDANRLSDLASKQYKEQAKWFLNAFWEQFGSQSEKIWDYVNTMAELDLDHKSEGCAIDELQAHRFLERFNETLTVQAMRDRLRSTGAIGGSVRLVPLIHILIFKFNVDWHVLINAPQGNREEIDKAQALLDEVQEAFSRSEARANEAAAAFKEAKARENEAKAREAEARDREDEAREREAPFKQAQEEVDNALAEVKSQEDARNAKTEELTRKSTEGGIVQQNRAKNELAQHLGEDPLPLRRAKITLEAALKKAEKARAPFEEATRQAEAARAAAEAAARDAEAARKRSEKAKQAAEEALEEARQRLAEAEAYLEEVKARIPHGTQWWMERELYERRKYLPKAKGGVDK